MIKYFLNFNFFYLRIKSFSLKLIIQSKKLFNLFKSFYITLVFTTDTTEVFLYNLFGNVYFKFL